MMDVNKSKKKFIKLSGLMTRHASKYCYILPFAYRDNETFAAISYYKIVANTLYPNWRFICQPYAIRNLTRKIKNHQSE